MMRCYLLDTGIAQDDQSDRGDVRERVIALRRLGDRVGICTPVLGELWSGVEGSSTKQRNLQKLLQTLTRLIIWPYTEEAAREYGRIYFELRRTGRMIQQVDIQVGAIARTLPNCTIVSKDSDMSAIPDAKVEDWATSSP